MYYYIPSNKAMIQLYASFDKGSLVRIIPITPCRKGVFR